MERRGAEAKQTVATACNRETSISAKVTTNDIECSTKVRDPRKERKEKEHTNTEGEEEEGTIERRGTEAKQAPATKSTG